MDQKLPHLAEVETITPHLEILAPEHDCNINITFGIISFG